MGKVIDNRVKEYAYWIGSEIEVAVPKGYMHAELIHRIVLHYAIYDSNKLFLFDKDVEHIIPAVKNKPYAEYMAEITTAVDTFIKNDKEDITGYVYK